MAYFANSSEGMAYEYKWCRRCVHLHAEHSCPCLDAHAMWNYDECSAPDSILHKMIPRNECDNGNEKCIFFVEENSIDDNVTHMKNIRTQLGLNHYENE